MLQHGTVEGQPGTGCEGMGTHQCRAGEGLPLTKAGTGGLQCMSCSHSPLGFQTAGLFQWRDLSCRCISICRGRSRTCMCCRSSRGRRSGQPARQQRPFEPVRLSGQKGGPLVYVLFTIVARQVITRRPSPPRKDSKLLRFTV